MSVTTAFKQFANNAITTSTSAVWNTTTDPATFTVATGTGALFPALANGFFMTVWTGSSGPGADANREIVLCTAHTGGSDTFTVARNQQGTSASAHGTGVTVNVALLPISQHFTDYSTAINNLESVVYRVAGVPLTGAKWVPTSNTSLSSGTNDLYTCPSNKRAIVTWGLINNPTGGSIDFKPLWKIGSNYYRTMDIQTVTAGNVTTNDELWGGIILEATEKLAINCTAGGGKIWAKVLEFDSTSRLSCKKVTDPTAGVDNTIYTCPASTSAAVIDSSMTGGSINWNGGLNSTNDTTANSDHSWNLVPNGSSNSATFNMFTTTVSNGGRFFSDIVATFAAGDFLVFKASHAGSAGQQIAWANIVEVPQ